MDEQNATTVTGGTYFGTAHLGALPREAMSEADCVKHGGHCFEDTGTVLTSLPPQYPQECKHCRKRRVAVPREAFTYHDLT